MLDEQSTKFGGVETWQDAKKCAALFDEHRQQINGVLVVLPNFGDEKGVAVLHLSFQDCRFQVPGPGLSR